MKIINSDFRDALDGLLPQKMCFADPPDNLGLNYTGFKDKMPDSEYRLLLKNVLECIRYCKVLWVSFNPNHMALMGELVRQFMDPIGVEHRFIMQHVTFGYYSQKDFGRCFRPLLRLKWPSAEVYPDAVRIESERQRIGDKRANPNGKIPGDVWHFARVVGNAKERRRWHPTQLNELLYQRCLKYSCVPGDRVCDVFAGTGTLGRAAAGLDLDVTLIDTSEFYCNKMSEEFGVPVNG